MMGNNSAFWNSADNRKVAIKVTGVYRRDITSKSVYTIIVPYCRFSETIQQINRLGGQIIEVSVRSSALTEPSQTSPNPQILETSTEATEPELSKSSEVNKMAESETPLQTSRIPDSITIATSKSVKESEISTENFAVDIFEEVSQNIPNQLAKPAFNQNLPEAKVFPETLTPLNAPKALSKIKTKLRKKKSRLKEAIAKKYKSKK